MSSMTTPIVDFVRQYARSGTSRLHMPGHKGQPFLGCEAWDITEIKGADELYEAEGIIARSEANATALFGTAHTYYSTEGSSQCIRAMLCLALQAAPAAGQRPVLLAARNAHKALLYAAALLDFDIQWLWPAPQDAGALCSCPVSAAKLTGALQGLAQQGKRPFGVYITSPDYLGGVQDIAALAEVCRDFGVPLLVDNAHGAYLRFLPQGGQHPIALGAAMQQIVVGTEQDGKAAIGYLKRTGGGRATFLPMSNIQGRSLQETGLENCRGFVGIASELTASDEKYRGIVENLLGRTVIVSDMDAAIAMAQKSRGRFKIVTLDGQVMNPGGSMTGGSVNKEAGILSRANELEKLGNMLGVEVCKF